MINSLNTENMALMLISAAAGANSAAATGISANLLGGGEILNQDINDTVEISPAAMKMQGR